MTWIEYGVIYLAVLYLIFAIDDLIFDVTYWVGVVLGWWRRVVLTQAQLEAEPEARVAVIVAAWHEAPVIGRMLTYNAGRIDYGDYDFWIGTYPNDPETQTEVDRVRAFLPQAYRVTTGHDGPTSKADCLNAILSDIIRHESRTKRPYDFVLMHDPEDIIHPLEMRVLNWHFRNTDADFIQLPVFSTETPNIYDLVAGTYIDEFAEMYAKNMHVRQLLSPFVPSAGVATGIRRSALNELVDTSGGLPFATNSLTEDYDLGLKMAISGRKTRYVAQKVRLLRSRTRLAPRCDSAPVGWLVLCSSHGNTGVGPARLGSSGYWRMTGAVRWVTSCCFSVTSWCSHSFRTRGCGRLTGRRCRSFSMIRCSPCCSWWASWSCATGCCNVHWPWASFTDLDKPFFRCFVRHSATSSTCLPRHVPLTNICAAVAPVSRWRGTRPIMPFPPSSRAICDWENA